MTAKEALDQTFAVHLCLSWVNVSVGGLDKRHLVQGFNFSKVLTIRIQPAFMGTSL